jgi:hypothetical protein
MAGTSVPCHIATQRNEVCPERQLSLVSAEIRRTRDGALLMIGARATTQTGSWHTGGSSRTEGLPFSFAALFERVNE